MPSIASYIPTKKVKIVWKEIVGDSKQYTIAFITEVYRFIDRNSRRRSADNLPEDLALLLAS